MKTKIAIQGIRSSWHHVAASTYFGNEIELVECDSFRILCNKLKSNEADFAVMAIENTIAGSILPNYALLQEYKFGVIGELFVHIRMHLMGVKGAKLNEIKVVESHPMAILQCAEYLESLPNIKIVEKDDTAKSAKIIVNDNLKNNAAIAGIAAAKEFGLDVLAESIETNKNNFTRFLILSKEKKEVENANKASLSFHLAHEVGSLAEVLTLFAKNKVNLTKIQSIPIVGKPYEYIFHIDLEYSDKENYTDAMKNIAPMVSGLEVFGNYLKADRSILDLKNKNN